MAAALALGLIAGLDLARTQELSIKVLVNDDPISDYDIEQRERFLAITTQDRPGPELKKKATDLLIEERLQLQEGRKLGISPDEDDKNTILSDMAAKNKLDVAGLTTALARAGVNIKTLEDRIKAQLVWQDVVRRKFQHTVQIGEVDIDEALSESGETIAGAVPEATRQLRQVRFALPSGADQRTIAARLAAAEALRARFSSCPNVTELAKSVEGASIETLKDQQANALAQPARLLVTKAKIGQMTPPTISSSAVELYAVCGKRSTSGDTDVREQAQKKLLNEEMKIRADKLLRDLKQDAFIEYR